MTMTTGSILPLCLLLLGPASASRFNYRLTDRTGYIHTPNYPDNYPHNADAYWEFVRPNQNTSCIRFTVEDFDVPSDLTLFTNNKVTCPGDHFVLDSCGSWWDLSPERLLCGNLTSSGRPFSLYQFYQLNATSLRVSFHSDSAQASTGFLMQYEMLDDCKNYGAPVYSELPLKSGEKVPCLDWNDQPSGQIQTPGYPNGYPADTSCLYVFEKPGPEYCGIFLYTTKFDLEPQDSSGTCHDYLVHPGCTKSCGRRESPSRYFFEYQPGSNILQLQFRSDFIDSGRGFLIDFYQQTDCFNPFQPECPNDQLNPYRGAGECYSQERHDCSANEECDGGRVCCFDGCYRRCVAPVTDVRKRRSLPSAVLPAHGGGPSGLFHYPAQPLYWDREDANNRLKMAGRKEGNNTTPAPSLVN